MTNNLSTNSSTAAAKVLLSQVETPERQEKRVAQSKDTLQVDLKKQEKRQVEVLERPTLPVAKKSADSNALAVMAEAFAAAYKAMDNGIRTSMKDYVGLQQLDKTISECVLRSTILSVKKMKHEMKVEKQIKAKDKKLEKQEKTLRDVMLGVGIALAVVFVISLVVTAGASAVALPEMGEAFAGAAASLAPEAAGDGAADAAADGAVDAAAESAGAGASEGASSGVDAIDMDTEESMDVEETGEKTADELDKSKSSIRPKVMKGLGGMGLASILASPQIMEGYINIHVIAPQDRELAKIQKDIGDSVSVVQENRMYQKFYQQLVQRMSGIENEEVSDASEIVGTYADVTNGYKAIAYGLAASV